MFEHTFNVPYYGLDMNGRVKVSLLLQFLQETAALHADGVGVGVASLMERGMTWVLRRYRVRVRRYPGGSGLAVRTWFEPRKNLKSVRVFEVRDESGDVVADAWSAWIVVDIERGRPVRLDRALPAAYFNVAEPTGKPVEDSIPPQGGDFDREAEFRVRWGEMDLNGHTNHTVYFDWAIESTPDDVVDRCEPCILDAEYVSSVPRGYAVARTRKTADDPLKFAHEIYAKGTSAVAARLATTWRSARR
ncbi:MAG: hypothetical protein LBS75_08170 [Synergistaceae bacterium]|jgi:acyl-ACP thioesterase|nr:hypothetical protein [Synergistaceae bacterium]